MSPPAIRRVRIGRVKLTVWPRSLPWLLEIGRHQLCAAAPVTRAQGDNER